jgi:hypothetical protein
MKSPINFFKKIKLLFSNNSQIETERFLIAQKSCPHCASRGMFIFDTTTNSKYSNGQSHENKT